MTTPSFRVGHPVCSGANAFKAHWKYAQALHDLMSRGVPMKAAHRALKQALAGSHATCSTMRNGRSTDTVEVTYFKSL